MGWNHTKCFKWFHIRCTWGILGELCFEKTQRTHQIAKFWIYIFLTVCTFTCDLLRFYLETPHCGYKRAAAKQNLNCQPAPKGYCRPAPKGLTNPTLKIQNATKCTENFKMLWVRCFFSNIIITYILLQSYLKHLVANTLSATDSGTLTRVTYEMEGRRERSRGD